MKSTLKKLLAAALTLTMAASVLGACTGSPSVSSTPSSDTPSSESPSSTAQKELIGSGALKYDPNAEVNGGKDITIKFWYDDPGPDGYQRYAKAIEDYQKIHTNVTFDVNKSLGWDDYWKKAPVAAANGTGPDIMHFHLGYTSQFIPNLAEPYPEDMYDALSSDFGNLEPYKFDGKLYTLPAGNSTGVMFYNKKMWKDAGLTDADIPKTWDELREVAKKLTKTENGKIVVNGMDIASGWMLIGLNYQKGNFWFKDDGLTTQLNNPGMVEAVSMLQDMIKTDKVYNPGSGSAQERFGNQQSAMVYEWTWLGGWLEGNVEAFEWGVFPTPAFEGAKVIDRNNPEATAIVNSKSPDDVKAVAMDFIKFYLASDEYLAELANKVYLAPTKKTLADDAAIQQNEVVKTISSYIDKTVWVGTISSDLDAAVSSILSDKLLMQLKDPAEVLKEYDDLSARLAPDTTIKTKEREATLAGDLK